jgi:hypothetical protein
VQGAPTSFRAGPLRGMGGLLRLPWASHPEPEALEVVLPGRKALLASTRSSIG